MTTQLPRIECIVTFLPENEGGRTKPFPLNALSNNTYRPHIVASNTPHCSVAAIGSQTAEDYIGVAFDSGPSKVSYGKEIDVTLTLIFYPHPFYDRLQPGATFTVREGHQIVAYGKVLKWVSK